MDSAQSNDLAAKAEIYLRLIEEIDDELVTEKGAYTARCRVLRSSRKDVFGEAKIAGIAVKPLKAVVKRRKLERSIEALGVDFDVNEAAQYSALAEAFAGTPFGDFAAARAGADDHHNDGDVKGAPRPDEEHVTALRARLTRIGLDPVDTLADH